MKNGSSPVSEADRAIDLFLLETFAKERPDYGWLSEETDDNEVRLSRNRVVVADPIDGTRGFIDGRTEWCVSIAIVENHRPIEAILHCPALNRTFSASKGQGLKISGETQSRPANRTLPLVTGSKKLIETIRALPGNPTDVLDFIPSLAYRLAMVSSGELDAAFARGGASEWDVAAADLILEEAGCKLTTIGQKPLLYNQDNVRMPALIAAADEKYQEILTLAKEAGFLH